MRAAVDHELERRGHVASRAELLRVLSRNQLDDEIRRGHLVAVFPRAYARPWDADDPGLRERAALVSVGYPAALSHLTALRRWALPAPDDGSIHVSVPATRHPQGRPGELNVHRVRRLPRAPRLDGLPTVLAEYAITAAWPMLRGADQRAPAIVAVRRRLVTPARLRDAAANAPTLPAASSFARLVSQLDAGCESELELWGYTAVFDVDGLRHARRQLRVRAGQKSYCLDLAYEQERVAVELDGRAYHSGPDQWERDIRRDLALATAGWQTVRFSHRRLTTDIDGCRKDTLAVLAARQAWRRSG